MTPVQQTLHALASTNHWSALAPEIGLGVVALVLLLLELVLPKRAVAVAVPRVAILGLVAMLGWVARDWQSAWLGQEIFGGMIRQTIDSQIMRVFFLLASLLVVFVASVVLPKHKMPRVEFHHVLLVCTGALMLLAQSNHFVLLFVALETVTVSLYVLVAYFRESPLSLEAGLKYLVTGSLSSALLLFGIVLLYGIAGNPLLVGHTANSMNFAELGAFLRLHPEEPLALVGAALVLSGIAFKIGAVPFQIWVPDVYQGAPTPVTAFLAVSSKAAGFALMLILVRGPFQPLAQLTVPLLSIFAALSLLFGNLAALGQRNVKRLMGLSGVSHAGFLLVGVVASIATSDAVSWAPAAVYFYLFTYLVGAMAAFGVMAHVSIDDDADQDLRHYAGLARRSPLLGATLACGVGSLAGIPPLAGFIGKLLIFVAAFQAHQWTLLAIAIVAVVISIYYYFGWIRAAFYEEVPAAERNVAPLHLGVAASFTLIALALASVLLGLYQGPLGQWIAGR
ncbi:MAG TPA: NADH-quinone oxidoreductase subunit N [Opitutaceae bacterium]|nr:NADH-quinone oxidoreductase subunit N [Opitutaceae bacterium]